MILLCRKEPKITEATCDALDHEAAPQAPSTARVTEQAITAIDEDKLSWFYIAPGYEEDATTRALVDFALELIGPQAWIVIEAGDQHGQALCDRAGLRIFESYRNKTAGPWSMSVHLAQAAPQGPSSCAADGGNPPA